MHNFNCKFCYCPLYFLPIDCGGNYRILKGNIKDCTKCNLIHDGERGLDHVHKKIDEYFAQQR